MDCRQSTKADRFIAQHRGSRASHKASEALNVFDHRSNSVAFDRIKHNVIREQPLSADHAELLSEILDDRFRQLEKGDEIEKLLAEVKSRRQLNG